MNKIDINIATIRQKFKEKIEPSGWGNILNPIIDDYEFDTAINKLKKEVENGNRFTPVLGDIFNAFIYCPYDKFKAVIIGQDPYPQLGVADGISFSCSKTGKIQPSLRYIYSEIQRQYPDILTDHLYKKPDLKRWSEQGVLMLNTAFTVQIGKIGSHYDIWKPITNKILTKINDNFNNTPIALLGKKAEEWQLKLNKQKIYKVPHPASAAYKGGKWDSKDLFKKINRALIDENNHDPIIWL